ncbi:MAG: hypothetical protein KDC54_00810 [Lewinella sp.]|nr:hypothetical protein [Lewinella sp.]
MTPNTPNPNPAPVPPSTPRQPDNSKQRLIAVAAVVIVALLAVNAFLLYKYIQTNKANDHLAAELDESTQFQAELQAEYDEASAELDALRSDNEELNALIDQKQVELDEARNRIERLARDSRNYESARAELAQLRNQVDGYLAEINELREQNAMLTEENSQLAMAKDSLSQNLSTERQTNMQLNEERALLVSERDQLSNTNQDLSRTVTRASVIEVAGLEAGGQKIRNSGKPVTRRSADNVEQVSVCFNTTINEIAEPGEEEFFVRIINPQGETLAIESLGSGIFTNAATGEQMRYTMSRDITYDRDANSVCMVWAPGQAFQIGDYQVEIYNKGHLAGSTILELR